MITDLCNIIIFLEIIIFISKYFVPDMSGKPLDEEQVDEHNLFKKIKRAVEQKNSDLVFEVCKHCSEVEALSFLHFKLFDNAVGDEVETMVSALFVIAKGAMSDLNCRKIVFEIVSGEKIVHRFICYGRGQFVRNAALSALLELKTSTIWKDYFTLMDILEEL
ncbi:hypothetical protein X798_02247 [Onchocerca flexuosa]|uniref:Uncharacterized protein n=1 Tax=Onchocerca flexuosa TaxID=387005 RepID=A0A238C0D3_9BILA|nr:hypothetical protein X798_02247 [Onchocerca flexuosa]